jgi:hypothetical protein
VSKIIAFAVALLLASPSTFADYESSASKKAVDNFNFVDLRSIVESSKARSIEDVLPLIPETLRSNYVLMYGSRSLQGSSFQNPRVLLFGETAKLIVAFNGEKSQNGYNELEVVSFDEANARFDFYEITFKNGRGQVSEKNPSKCLQCHQSAFRENVDPRPNWEPYAFWPGAYGSFDGRFHKEDPGYLARYSVQYAQLVKHDEQLSRVILSSPQEPVEFAKFYANKNQHPRYKYLLEPDMSDTPKYNPREVQAVLDFTSRVGMLNFKRISRLMRETPHYDRYKYAAFSSLICTDDSTLERALPKSLFDFHIENTKKRPVRGIFRTAKMTYEWEQVFEPLGVDTSDWSLDFRTQGRFSNSGRFTPGKSPEVAIQEPIRRGDPSIEVLSCEQMSKKSLKLLSGFVPQIPPSNPKKMAGQMLARCIVCHTGVDPEGPYIPFDDLSKLSTDLKDTNLLEKIKQRTDLRTSPDERMPKGTDITEEQRANLLRFFESLISN